MQVVMALSPSTYVCLCAWIWPPDGCVYCTDSTCSSAPLRRASSIICDTRLVEQARHDRAPVEYSHFVDYAVLMDEAYLLARYVTEDPSSGFESEWLSWSELKNRHSVKRLKELFEKSSTWLGDNANAQRLLTHRVNSAKLADDSS
jgi:hypothetical protein